MKVIGKLFLITIAFFVIYILIRPDVFFQRDVYFYFHDTNLFFNTNYLMVNNFSNFNLPLAQTYRHLGEPLGFYHLWTGIYAFQNLIIGFLIRLFHLQSIPFKYLYLSFNIVFNGFLILSGFYLIFRKFTHNFFTIFVGFIYIFFFGFCGMAMQYLQYLNVVVFAPFFYLAMINFFGDETNTPNFIIMVLSGALLFFYGPMYSAAYFTVAFFLLVGIFVSYYLKIFNYKNIVEFLANTKNWPIIMITLLAAFIIVFPNLYIYQNELEKFSLFRNFVNINGLIIAKKWGGYSYGLLGSLIPIFRFFYIGVFFFLLIVFGIIYGTSRFKIIFLI